MAIDASCLSRARMPTSGRDGLTLSPLVWAEARTKGGGQNRICKCARSAAQYRESRFMLREQAGVIDTLPLFTRISLSLYSEQGQAGCVGGAETVNEIRRLDPDARLMPHIEITVRDTAGRVPVDWERDDKRRGRRNPTPGWDRLKEDEQLIS
ncbi:hypothetical protein PIIN_06490 [Serendipita indica DSM 11827]|uniref:Uncharacterized protein n=1 Tax=Serendipita indica (strain DSM 11827) TaxID=1109443 RepID=G4TMK8_SERID|nr:hypothetical protein PIIN_06490 [Serendipita indica DSM 11827]